MKLFKKASVGILAALLIGVSAPIGANAEWKQDSVGWWYTQGNSYLTGWQQINDIWYYFDFTGYMKTGWQAIDGSWYYFDNDGAMVANGVINGFATGPDGRLISQSDYNTSVQSAENQSIDNFSNSKDKVVIVSDNPKDKHKELSADEIIRNAEKN